MLLQSLLLLTYLVKNGSERVVTNTRDHIYDLRQLESFSHFDEYGKDQGINSKFRDVNALGDTVCAAQCSLHSVRSRML